MLGTGEQIFGRAVGRIRGRARWLFGRRRIGRLGQLTAGGLGVMSWTGVQLLLLLLLLLSAVAMSVYPIRVAKQQTADKLRRICSAIGKRTVAFD